MGKPWDTYLDAFTDGAKKLGEGITDTAKVVSGGAAYGAASLLEKAEEFQDGLAQEALKPITQEYRRDRYVNEAPPNLPFGMKAVPRSSVVSIGPSQAERTGKFFTETTQTRQTVADEMLKANPRQLPPESMYMGLRADNVPKVPQVAFGERQTQHIAYPEISAHGDRALSKQSMAEQIALNANPVVIATSLVGTLLGHGPDPKSQVQSFNFGRKTAELPAAFAIKVKEKAGEFIDGVQKDGLHATVDKTLGLDKDPVGNTWAGRGRAPDDWVSQGTSQIVPQVAELFLAPWQLAIKGAREMTGPGSTLDTAEGAITGAKDITTGMVRSFVRTALDPKDEFSRGAVQQFVNFAPIRMGLLDALDDFKVRPGGKGTSKIAFRDALDQVDSLKGVRGDIDARVAKLVDERAVLSEYLDEARSELDKAHAARSKAYHAEGFKLPEGEYFDKVPPKGSLSKFETRVNLATKIWDEHRSRLAEFDNTFLDLKAELLGRRELVDGQLRKMPAYKAFEDIVKGVTGLGSVLTMPETAAIVFRRMTGLDNPGKGSSRWLWRSRDARVPEKVQAVERESAGASRATELWLQDEVRRIPEEHRPIVREMLLMEHRPIFDIDPKKNLATWDKTTDQWVLTEGGKKAVAADPKLAMEVEGKLHVANQWGVNLAQKSLELTREAVDLGLFEHPDKLRHVYWPNVYDKTLGARNRQSLAAKKGEKALELEPEGGRLLANKLRREGVPIEAREAQYGMSKDLMSEAITGLARFKYDIEMFKLYRETAKDTKVVIGPDAFAELYKRDRVAAKAWVKVPDEPLHFENPHGPRKYGDWSGKYVHEDAWWETANARKIAEDMRDWLPQLLTSWKYAHTALSAATTSRNLLSNLLVFGPAAGLSLLDPRNARFFSMAVSDLMSQTKLPRFHEAYKHGAFHGGFTQTELVRGQVGRALQGGGKTITEPFRKLFEMTVELSTAKGARGVKGKDAGYERASKAGLEAWRALKEFPGELYGAMDNVFRLASFYKDRFKGIMPNVAGLNSRQRFIDYEQVSGAVQVMRAPVAPYRMKWETLKDGTTNGRIVESKGAQLFFYTAGQPFLAFTARAMPLMKNWLASNPFKASLYMHLSDYITGLNLAEAGLDPEQVKRSVAGLPFYERTRFLPAGMMHPDWAKDDEGRVLRMNVAYMTPFDLVVPQPDTFSAADGDPVPFMSQWTVGANPLTGPLANVLMNYDPYFKKEVWNPGATSGERWAQRLSYLMRSYPSPLTPGLTDIIPGLDVPEEYRIGGGQQYEKIRQAEKGERDYRGRERPKWQAYLDALGGVKITGATDDEGTENVFRDMAANIGKIEAWSEKVSDRNLRKMGINKAAEPEKALEAFAKEFGGRSLPVLLKARRILVGLPKSEMQVALVEGLEEIAKEKDPVEQGGMIRSFIRQAQKTFGDLRTMMDSELRWK